MGSGIQDWFYQRVLRPIAFGLDPEWVHERAMAFIQSGRFSISSHPFQSDSFEAFGVHFPNRLGLAAGFDKNAVALDSWHRYGFGFVEIGTVTWHAQPGNPKPRLFRLPEDQALINRMGFNNHGAEQVAERIARSSPQIPVGINLGKSKITELEEAHLDYQKSFRVLKDLGQYFVVNVSSPNTPGLRSLQERGPLERIISGIRETDESKPLFVKIAPDLAEESVSEVVEVAQRYRLQGVIATNTTLSRSGLVSRHQSETGGLSGKPVKELSNRVLRQLREEMPDEMMLIGVGGVFNHTDYVEKRNLGCELVQLYTGWIYRGPWSVPKIIQGPS